MNYINEAQRKRRESHINRFGKGLLTERSSCCHARISSTRGGLKIKRCSKCGNMITERKY